MTQPQEPGRTEPPYGQQPPYAQPGSEQPSYGQQPQPGQPAYGQSPYGQQPTYEQPSYGQPQYGQPSYEQQPAYGQPQYGQQPYGAPAPYGGQYGQPPAYGQVPGQVSGYGPYGAGVPARPGHVVTAAVLGFVLGAFGVLATVVLFIGGAFISGGGVAANDEIPGLGAVGGAIGGALIFVGLLALAWTVIIIWGSVRALSGRSRVMLLVAGAIALGLSLIGFLGSLGDSTSNGGGIVVQLLFLLAALAIVVLLCLRPAADFFAAHRARRRV